MSQPNESRKLHLVTAGIIAIIVLIVGGYYFESNDNKKKPVTSIKADASRKLIFSDEFNGSSLDKSKWNACYDNYSVQYQGCTNYGNNESEWYKSSQVTESGGNLVLSAQKQPTAGSNQQGHQTNYAYTSGMVSTGPYLPQTPEKWSRTYGYYEARINVPAGQAMWPAFWLAPIAQTWPPEIDAMEILGDQPNKLINTYFWKDLNGNAAKDSSNFISPTSLTNTWHVYAVDWEPNTIDWYLDGKLVKHVASKNVPSMNMQIILNLAVGGQLPGEPTSATPSSAKMLVDYVRVYQ